MKARVHITIRKDVLDPQGAAIGRALRRMGFSGIDNVRQGKVIEFEVAAADSDAARRDVEAMCKGLLANPVIEDYAIEIVG